MVYRLSVLYLSHSLCFADDAVNAVCSGPQLTSLKLWLCSKMTTSSFADAEDDGVRPSVWMTSLAAPNVRVVL